MAQQQPLTQHRISHPKNSGKHKTVLELNEMEIHKKKSVPNYQKLKTMVKISRHGRDETGAVIKNRKRKSGVERGKGTCYQWEEKGQCSKGDQCSFRHESKDRAQNPEHTTATPSEPSFSRGRSVSNKRSIQGKSIQMLFERYLHEIVL